MEPVTVSAMIGTVVGYLVDKLKDNKSINNFFSDFTEATVNWIKPIFIKEDQPKDVLINLQTDPSDDLNQKDAANAIERVLRQSPETIKLLKQMVDVIEKTNHINSKTNSISISGNSNKNYQDITESTITDNSINQNHSGQGDNIGRDKINNV